MAPPQVQKEEEQKQVVKSLVPDYLSSRESLEESSLANDRVSYVCC